MKVMTIVLAAIFAVSGQALAQTKPRTTLVVSGTAFWLGMPEALALQELRDQAVRTSENAARVGQKNMRLSQYWIVKPNTTVVIGDLVFSDGRLVQASKNVADYGPDTPAHDFAEVLTGELTRMREEGYSVARVSSRTGVLPSEMTGSTATRITTTTLQFLGSNRRIKITVSSRSVEMSEEIGYEGTP